MNKRQRKKKNEIIYQDVQDCESCFQGCYTQIENKDGSIEKYYHEPQKDGVIFEKTRKDGTNTIIWINKKEKENVS